ncbi:DUF5017 domain-containing protein [Arenibacter sp. F26102]|uniref:DUF5017 domain-containing protein n=1 Tax=Arenibacter sp. F26102 TaxID=2926416 RepID=UPI001FF4833E|nr:DUF5017 domain-containing protein [Arenibacter sp. F26102]MCK0146482.1 DUF5017 domain-containing protein [Arenibacter sp. F26102]
MKNIYSMIVLACAFLTSCQDDSVDLPTLNVSVEKSEYVEGELAQFQLTGNADFVTFFSGEVGSRHEFSGRTSAEGTPIMSFNSALANGSQESSLQLLISQDLYMLGTRDSATVAQGITTATWTDITDRAEWATSSSNKGSGDIDLTDFSDKPVYLAFKYKGYPGSVQNKWTISSLAVKNNLADSTSYNIANHGTSAINNYGVSTTVSPGWVGSNLVNSYNWGVSSSNFVITGSTNAGTAAEAEAWCISGPIDLTHVTPDVGKLVKNMSASMTDYEYQFNTAGEYKVSFVGKASNIYGAEEVVKELDVVVQPLEED